MSDVETLAPVSSQHLRKFYCICHCSPSHRGHQDTTMTELPQHWPLQTVQACK